EVALSGAGVASLDDGDPLTAVASLGEPRPDGDAVLHLDRRGDRHQVPRALRKVTDEVAPARVGVGRGVVHLAERVDGGRSHGEQRGARAVVEMQVVVVQARALLHQEPEHGVEGFLAGTADPEVALALALHPDEPLLEHATLEHELVDAQELLARESALTWFRPKGRL